MQDVAFHAIWCGMLFADVLIDATPSVYTRGFAFSLFLADLAAKARVSFLSMLTCALAGITGSRWEVNTHNEHFLKESSVSFRIHGKSQGYTRFRVSHHMQKDINKCRCSSMCIRGVYTFESRTVLKGSCPKTCRHRKKAKSKYIQVEESNYPIYYTSRRQEKSMVEKGKNWWCCSSIICVHVGFVFLGHLYFTLLQC